MTFHCFIIVVLELPSDLNLSVLWQDGEVVDGQLNFTFTFGSVFMYMFFKICLNILQDFLFNQKFKLYTFPVKENNIPFRHKKGRNLRDTTE